jgi:hypothetical protein
MNAFQAASLNICSELFPERFVFLRIVVDWKPPIWRIPMRKLILALAALGSLGLLVPYAAPANADPAVIVHHHHHHHHHGKTVIIKKDH